MPHLPDIRVVEDASQVAANAGEWLVDAARRALEARGRCAIVLAGGTTPAAAYRNFAAHNLEWSGVTFWLGDERCVPADDDQSNGKMARQTLELALQKGAKLELPPPCDGDAQAAARQYGERFPVADILILGMGEDGHTASLFPHHVALHEQHERVIFVDGTPKPPPRRITITRRVIVEARETLVLVAGAGKSGALAQVIAGGQAEDLPIRWAARPHAVWFVDRAAWAKVVK